MHVVALQSIGVMRLYSTLMMEVRALSSFATSSSYRGDILNPPTLSSLKLLMTERDLLELLHHPYLLLCSSCLVSVVSHVPSMPSTALLNFHHLLDCH